MRKMGWVGTLAVALLALSGTQASRATSLRHSNLGELIGSSELILVGKVEAVTDGFDGRVPYTEIALRISESIKGGESGLYTFRQFGRQQPAPRTGGRVQLGLSPQGWPRFAAGEEVVLFLYKRARITGLRTTVGLFQGKFTVENGRVANSINNARLFDRITVRAERLAQAERALLTKPSGAISSELFLSFVRKAVTSNWFEGVN